MFFYRFLIFLGLWIVLDGIGIAGLLIGVPSAVLAGWLGCRYFPSTRIACNPRAMLSFVGHFLWSSIVAGVDVAVRAFHPRLPLQSGFVTCACGIPVGLKRDLFLAVTSLMPGSLPVGEDGESGILLHCLDTTQPMAIQMADHESRMKRAWGEDTGHA